MINKIWINELIKLTNIINFYQIVYQTNNENKNIEIKSEELILVETTKTTTTRIKTMVKKRN